MCSTGQWLSRLEIILIHLENQSLRVERLTKPPIYTGGSDLDTALIRMHAAYRKNIGILQSWIGPNPAYCPAAVVAGHVHIQENAIWHIIDGQILDSTRPIPHNLDLNLPAAKETSQQS
jgi:hypothetical protein